MRGTDLQTPRSVEEVKQLVQVQSIDSPAACDEDHSKTGCLPAAHEGPWWIRVDHGGSWWIPSQGPSHGAGGCPKAAMTPLEAFAGAGSW